MRSRVPSRRPPPLSLSLLLFIALTNLSSAREFVEIRGSGRFQANHLHRDETIFAIDRDFGEATKEGKIHCVGVNCRRLFSINYNKERKLDLSAFPFLSLPPCFPNQFPTLPPYSSRERITSYATHFYYYTRSYSVQDRSTSVSVVVVISWTTSVFDRIRSAYALFGARPMQIAAIPLTGCRDPRHTLAPPD